jgi:site-specific recombinase XerD
MENGSLNAPKSYMVIATALGKWGQVKPNTKTMKARVLPISEKFRWIFESNSGGQFVFTRKEKPYSNKMLNTTWKRANKLANNKYKTHIINLRNGTRHSFACQCLNEGFRLHKVKTALGRSDPRTTDRYGRYSVELWKTSSRVK